MGEGPTPKEFGELTENYERLGLKTVPWDTWIVLEELSSMIASVAAEQKVKTVTSV